MTSFIMLRLSRRLVTACVTFCIFLSNSGLPACHAGEPEPGQGDEITHFWLSNVVFSSMFCQGFDGTIYEVDSLLEEFRISSGDGVLTSSHLIRAFNHFGFVAKTRFARSGIGSASDIPRYSIIVLPNEQGESRHPSDYLLFEGYTAAGLAVRDFSSNYPVKVLPFSHFGVGWDGEYLEVRPMPSRIAVSAFFLLVVISVFAATLAILRLVISHRGGATMPAVGKLKTLGFASVLFCLVYVGCSGRTERSEVPTEGIVFDTRVFDAGIIDHENAASKFRFNFLATNRSSQPLSISRIETDCSCAITESEVIGRLFAPGESVEVSGEVVTEGKAGAFQTFVTIVTSGNGYADSSAVVKCIVQPKPRPNKKVLEFEYSRLFPISKPTTIQVAFLRKSSDATLQIDKALSDFDGLTLVNQETFTRVVYSSSESQLLEDRVLLTLQADSNPYSSDGASDIETNGFVQLAWCSGSQTSIPVERRMVSDVIISQDRVFAGSLPIEGNKTVNLSLSSRFGVPITLSAIKVHGDVYQELTVSSPGSFEGEERFGIVVSLDCTSDVGFRDASLTFEFEGDLVPDLVVPFRYEVHCNE